MTKSCKDSKAKNGDYLDMYSGGELYKVALFYCESNRKRVIAHTYL
jgi:hypothetical protein